SGHDRLSCNGRTGRKPDNRRGLYGLPPLDRMRSKENLNLSGFCANRVICRGDLAIAAIKSWRGLRAERRPGGVPARAQETRFRPRVSRPLIIVVTDGLTNHFSFKNPLCLGRCVCSATCVPTGDFLNPSVAPDLGMLSKPSARWGRFVH